MDVEHKSKKKKRSYHHPHLLKWKYYASKILETNTIGDWDRTNLFMFYTESMYNKDYKSQRSYSGEKKILILTTLSHTQANDYYPVSFRLQSVLNVKHYIEESSIKPVLFYLFKSIFTFLKYANIKTFE